MSHYPFRYPLRSLLCPTETVNQEQLETERKILAFEKTAQHFNRRGFLGAIFSAAAAATLASGRSASAQSSAIPAITDVLNFALNLEYLEANFYLYVSTGSGLSSSLNGGGVAVQGAPPKIALDAVTLAATQALAQDEVNHIAGLRAAITSLGGTPIPQPLINLGAHGPIVTQPQFLAAARQFTALGGSAYIGAAQYLVSNTGVLTTAARILGAEGQHAGALNYLCSTQGVVSPAIDALDVPPTPTSFFTLSAGTALAPSRTTSQVLGVAYGVSTATTTTPSAGTALGGFFPNGVNGNIKST